MQHTRLEYLLRQFLAKEINPAEESELFQMVNSEDYDQQVMEFMERIWDQPPSDQPISEEQSRKILLSILAHSETKVVSVEESQTGRKMLLRVAASVLIIAAGILVFYLFNRPSDGNKTVATTNPSLPYENDVAPGVTGAILKLADGSSIVLDNASDGELAREGDAQVVKNGGSLNYIREGLQQDQSIHYNTIETPKGRQFQMVLEDGTKVWLNSASSIRFPVVFRGNERKVEITGEAYFEVAKNKAKPFRVIAGGTNIEVLGTHFNINSYADEATVNTTLLEGSVRVKQGNNQKVLKPGEQAQVNPGGEIKTAKNVNISEIVAWKDNQFLFQNTDIKRLMRQLSRWYDVEVVFNNDHSESVTFIGEISMAVNLSTVLKMLEQTGEVKFAIEGKKILVSMKSY